MSSTTIKNNWVDLAFTERNTIMTDLTNNFKDLDRLTQVAIVCDDFDKLFSNSSYKPVLENFTSTPGTHTICFPQLGDTLTPAVVDLMKLGRTYDVGGNQSLRFLERTPEGEMIDGATNETVIIALLHRLVYLDAMFPCVENKTAIEHLVKALEVLFDRTTKRVQQNIEGQQVAHISV